MYIIALSISKIQTIVYSYRGGIKFERRQILWTCKFGQYLAFPITKKSQNRKTAALKYRAQTIVFWSKFNSISDKLYRLK